MAPSNLSDWFLEEWQSNTLAGLMPRPRLLGNE